MHLPKAVCDEGGVGGGGYSGGGGGGGGTAAVRRRALYRMENARTGFGPPRQRTDIPDSVNRLNCARFTPRALEMHHAPTPNATNSGPIARFQPVNTADRGSARESVSVTRDNPARFHSGDESVRSRRETLSRSHPLPRVLEIGIRGGPWMFTVLGRAGGKEKKRMFRGRGGINGVRRTRTRRTGVSPTLD